jgi:hypothetical protein
MSNKIEILQQYLVKTDEDKTKFETETDIKLFKIFNEFDSSIQYNESITTEFSFYSNGLNSLKIHAVDKIRYNMYFSPSFEIKFNDKSEIRSISTNIYTIQFENNINDEVTRYMMGLTAKLVNFISDNKSLFEEKITELYNSILKTHRYYNSKFNMISTYINFMKHIDSMLLENKIWEDKHYKSESGKQVPSFNNDTVYVDEIEFFRNPTGTYSVKLFQKGELKTQSTRCNESALGYIIKSFSN